MDSFIGNFYAKKQIQNLGNNSFLLLGPSGCGKTHFARAALHAHEVLYFEPESLANTNTCTETLRNFFQQKSLLDMFAKTSPRPKAVIVDNLESVPPTVTSLLLKQSKQARVPYIFIANVTFERKLTELKKHVQVLRIQPPSMTDCYLYWREQPCTEALEDSELLSIIKREVCNMNRLKQIFEQGCDFDTTTKDSLLGEKNSFELCEEFHQTAYSWQKLIQLTSMDVGQLWFLIHENGISKLKDKTQIKRWAHVFCDVAIMEEHAFKQGLWDLLPMAKLYGFGTTNAMLPVAAPNKLQASCLWKNMTVWSKKLHQFTLLQELPLRDPSRLFELLESAAGQMDSSLAEGAAEILARWATHFDKLPKQTIARLKKEDFS